MNPRRYLIGRFTIPLIVSLLVIFLYVPIMVLVTFSFNDSAFPYVWKGFTLRWYHELFTSYDAWHALKNSLTVATASVCLSMLMGLLLVVYGAKSFLGRCFFLFYGSLIIPEIILAVGLLTFFSSVYMPFGLTTLVAAHTLLGLCFVVPILQARYKELDTSLLEASMDLGATPLQTLRYVVIPYLLPALCASGFLVFIVSLDDFLISFFVAGPSTQTLPMYIFSAIRSGATPTINALSTLLLLANSFFVITFTSLNRKKTDIFS
jgi:spermidine/putrescine transport system permease protein